MTVISGSMTILLPGDEEWGIYEKMESFVVPANSSFKLKIFADTAYLCQFVG
jgi:hypothetical protein